MKDLVELTGALRVLDKPPSVVNGTKGALRIEATVSESYVWPNLRDWNSEPTARVCLIEAPGAVGKSAAAAAMAAKLRWPLVDAAKAQVGSYSLSGLIQDALGFNSPYIGEVVGGTAGVIVDALDEAHLKAGTANFLAFLDNIVKLSGEAGSGPCCLVLFSRPDTAVIVREYFQQGKTPLTCATIDFFSSDQAKAYVSSYMKARAKEHPDKDYEVAEKYPIPFQVLLEKRMAEIASTLLAQDVASNDYHWPDVAAFLGYAPVLGVLSELVAVANPHAAAENRVINSADRRARNILLRIIDDLLTREQGKFTKQVSAKLRAELPASEDWSGFDNIYDPHEQGIRLVAKLLKLEVAVPIPASMPTAIRESYERDASQFLADHPFLTGTGPVNAVFADYILAKAAVDSGCAASLRPAPSKSVENAGPFFYQFVYEISKDPDDGLEEGQISEDLLTVLLDSHAQSAAVSKGNLFSFYQHGDDAVLVLTDTFAPGALYLTYSVVDISGALHLPDYVSRGDLVTDAGLVLGERKRRFVLGPSAVLVAKEISIHAETISVNAGNEQGSSVISCDEIVTQGALTIDAPFTDALTVQSDSTLAVFRPYLEPPADRQHYATHGQLMDLRAVLKAFRQQAGNSPSVFEDLLDQRVVKNNAVRRHYLTRLIELGLVTQTNSHYYLDTKKLAGHGFSWGDMVGGSPNAAITEFLQLLGDSPAEDD
jgi:hypothetical protein